MTGVVDLASVVQRLDFVLERMAAEGMGVRAIYLTQADLVAFLSEQERLERPILHRGHPVREVAGKGKSKIYSDRGVGCAVPRRW